MARKVNKIKITQYQGTLAIYRNDELEQRYFLGDYMKRIQEGKITPSGFANFIGELLNDALNCKTASSAIEDLDDLRQYTETYFQYIDSLE